MAAKIILDGADYSTLTDSKGQYEFRNFPPGNYRGRISCPGFRTRAFYVILGAGQRRTLNVALPHEPSAINH